MFRRFYGRKSRLLGDPEDLDVFAHQINPLLRRAEAEGRPARPEEIVVEVGSGERIEERPAFLTILTQIERLPAAAGGELWSADVDRLSRGNMLERGRIAVACARAGVLLRTASRTLDLSDPDDLFWYEFTSGRATNEVGRFKARVEARRRELILAGEILTGLPPFGYVWNKNPRPGRRRGHLEPDPERFPVLKQVCREVLTTSLERLARRYGVSRSTLNLTLRNPAICGYPAWRWGANDGRRPHNKKRRVLLPRSEWVWAETKGDWPAACTRAEWDAIQATLDRRDSLKEKTLSDADGWCVDVLRINDRPVRRGSVGSGDRTRLVYETEVDGRMLWVLRGPVHDHAALALKEAFRRPETVREHLAEYQAGVTAAEAQSGSQAVLTALQQERRAREEELDELLLRELRAGPEEAASIARVRAVLLVEVKRLGQAIGQHERPPLRLPELEEVIHLLPKIAGVFDAYWTEAPSEVKRAVTRAVIKTLAVTITPSPKGTQRYQREIGPTLFQDWLPWGEK